MKKLFGLILLSLLLSTSVCLAQADTGNEARVSKVVDTQIADIDCNTAINNTFAESIVTDEILPGSLIVKQASRSFKILYPAYAIAPFSRATGDQALTPLPDEASSEDTLYATKAGDTVGRGFNWNAAFGQSMLFLTFQHVSRLGQAKTRRELKGPFFRDYLRSVRGLSGWGDGDGFVTNYLGHPAMGAISGYVQIQNDPRGMRMQISRSNDY